MAPEPSGSHATPAPKFAGHPALAWGMAALAAVWILAAMSPPRSFGDTLFSRLATVYALVHEGTFAITTPGEPSTNPFDQRTVDKVEVGGRILSSKPPVLPLAMAAKYIGTRAVLGWSLEDPDDLAPITRTMTLTFVSLPFLVLIWTLTRALQWLGLTNLSAGFLALAAIIGTQAGAYATVFNNHVPAAAAVMVCFYVAVRLVCDPGAARPVSFVVFGIATGIAATVDIPTTIFPALLGLCLARWHLRALLIWAVPPAATLLLIQSGVLFAATGSPLPVQLHPEAYLFENSHWRNPLGVDALNDPPAWYLFHTTLGRVGIFSLFPITLFAIPGVVLWVRRRERGAWIALSAIAGTVIFVAYYVLTTNNYGGSSFGFRWFIVLGPLCLLLAAPAIHNLRNRWVWTVAVLLLAASFVSMLQCARRPWEADQEWTVRIFGPSI